MKNEYDVNEIELNGKYKELLDCFDKNDCFSKVVEDKNIRKKIRYQFYSMLFAYQAIDNTMNDKVTLMVNLVNINCEKKGYIYFLQNKATKRTKIGFTKDLEKRKKQIQSSMETLGIEEGIEFLKILKVPVSLMGVIEAKFHLYFNKHRAFGEWFNINEVEIEECFKNMFEVTHNVLFKDGQFENDYDISSLFALDSKILFKKIEIPFLHPFSEASNFLKIDYWKNKKIDTLDQALSIVNQIVQTTGELIEFIRDIDKKVNYYNPDIFIHSAFIDFVIENNKEIFSPNYSEDIYEPYLITNEELDILLTNIVNKTIN